MTKKFRKCQLFLGFTILLLVFSILPQNLGNKSLEFRAMDEITNETPDSAYISHAPIFINGSDVNQDWDNVPGITGSGTINDPYLLTNLLINSTTTTAIKIINSNKYINITNCYLSGPKEYVWDLAEITINNCANISILHSIIIGGYNGIQIHNGVNITISFNTIQDSYYDAFSGYSLNGMIITQNQFIKSRNGNGMYLSSLYYSQIEANNFSLNRNYGFTIYSPYYSIISNNLIANNNQPQYVDDLSRNGIGAFFDWGQENLIQNNQFINNILRIRYLSSSILDTSNTVNGLPIYYYTGQYGLTLSGLSNIGELIISNSYNVILEGISMSYSGAIVVVNTENLTISGCTLIKTVTGLYLMGINNGLIINNYISGNTTCHGINFDYETSYNITIRNNYLQDVPTAISLHNIYGLTLSENQGINVKKAITVGNSYTTMIYNNQISAWIYYSSGSYFYSINTQACYIYSGLNHTIMNNTFNNFLSGICIRDTKNVLISGNQVNGTSQYAEYYYSDSQRGCDIQYGINYTIVNNNFITYTTGIYIYNTNNTYVNGNQFKALVSNSNNYYYNRYGCNSERNLNLTFVNNYLSDFTNGIHLINTNTSTISGNQFICATITESSNGIYLDGYSYYSVLIQNQFFNFYYAIRISSENNYGNMIMNNNFSYVYYICSVPWGSSASSAQNTITQNYFRHIHGVFYGDLQNVTNFYNNTLDPVMPTIPIITTGNLTIESTVSYGSCSISWQVSAYAEIYKIYFNGTVKGTTDKTNILFMNSNFEAKNATYEVYIIAFNGVGNSSRSNTIVIKYIYYNSTVDPGIEEVAQDPVDPFALDGFAALPTIFLVGILFVFLSKVRKVKHN